MKRKKAPQKCQLNGFVQIPKIRIRELELVEHFVKIEYVEILPHGLLTRGTISYRSKLIQGIL